MAVSRGRLLTAAPARLNVARFRARHVRLPLLSPFTTSFGTEVARSGLILSLEARSIEAFGECVAFDNPYYSYEDNQTAIHIIRDHLVKMIGDEPHPEEFMARAGGIRGHNMAKAAVEMLLWDFHSKAKERPLHKMLGASKGYADVGISLGIEKPDKMVARVTQAVERGYKRIKVKIEKGKEIGILSSIRKAHPHVPLSADANSCYTIGDARLLSRLDRYDLEYIEQPLEHDDLIDHARLRKTISTPICLDESVSSVEKARQAFEIGAADVINVKPGRVGGLANSLAIAALAREKNGHVWVGGMLETGIGRSFNIALASSKLVDYPGDTSPNDKYFRRDIVRNPFVMSRGRIVPNAGPGIGVDVDGDYLRKVTIEEPLDVELG
jgi:o-succinylbenzoate synthase